MSTIKLPPLPDLPELQIINEGDEAPAYGWVHDHLRAWAKAYAEEAVRKALEHAFNELNALFMETLKARIPGEDLDHNDEQFNIGMCAQALGISRCQHVLRGLSVKPETRDE